MVGHSRGSQEQRLQVFIFSGIPADSCSSSTVFSMAGLSGNTTLYSSAIQYVIFLVTTGIILPYIDRVGRRTLLLIGAISSLILHFTIAGVMATQGRGVDSVDGNDNLKWEVTGASGKAVIAMSYIFVGVYGFTWAPVGWIYCSEVFPLKYRAKGVGKNTCAPYKVQKTSC